MLVVMVGLLSGALWWEGWGRPGAARSSQEQPVESKRVQESQESSGDLWETRGSMEESRCSHTHTPTLRNESQTLLLRLLDSEKVSSQG